MTLGSTTTPMSPASEQLSAARVVLRGARLSRSMLLLPWLQPQALSDPFLAHLFAAKIGWDRGTVAPRQSLDFQDLTQVK